MDAKERAEHVVAVLCDSAREQALSWEAKFEAAESLLAYRSKIRESLTAEVGLSGSEASEILDDEGCCEVISVHHRKGTAPTMVAWGISMVRFATVMSVN
jgi:hypothetical protein